METFSALLSICAGNSPVIGEFPAQRSVTRSFGVFFDVRLNKRLSKQSWGWWFETPLCPSRRHCYAHYQFFVFLLVTCRSHFHLACNLVESNFRIEIVNDGHEKWNRNQLFLVFVRWYLFESFPKQQTIIVERQWSRFRFEDDPAGFGTGQLCCKTVDFHLNSQTRHSVTRSYLWGPAVNS